MTNNAEKPVDRWLGMGALVVTFALYLLPKSPTVVIGCLMLMFGLGVHPIWNLPWIEESKFRRYVAAVMLLVLIGVIGAASWPPRLARLRIGDVMLLPYTDRARLRLDVWNDGDEEIKFKGNYRVYLTPDQTQDVTVLRTEEEKRWKWLEDSSPIQPAAELTIPGKSKTWLLIDQALSPDETLAMQSRKGTAYFMAIFSYPPWSSDDKVDFCSVNYGAPTAFVTCAHHNGLHGENKDWWRYFSALGRLRKFFVFEVVRGRRV